MIGADPIQTGIVASLNRPGGNITGVGSMNVGLGVKRPIVGRFGFAVGTTVAIDIL
jgi:hypothetical protein